MAMTSKFSVLRMTLLLVVAIAALGVLDWVAHVLRDAGASELVRALALGMIAGLFGGIIIKLQPMTSAGAAGAAAGQTDTALTRPVGRAASGAVVLALIALWMLAGYLSLDASSAVFRSLMLTAAVLLALEVARSSPTSRGRVLRATVRMRRSALWRILTVTTLCFGIVLGVPLGTTADVVVAFLACLASLGFGYLGLRELDETERARSS